MGCISIIKPNVGQQGVSLMSKSYSWGQRLALIQAHSPADNVACTALGVSQEELETARELMAAGSITLDSSVVGTANIFEGVKASAVTARVTPATTSKTTAVVVTPKTTGVPPATASKPTRVPKKRGRRGSNIDTAFAAIPAEPTDAEKFAVRHSVSLAVLRQAKRFDKVGTGTVKVRKDRETGSLMVWREVETLPATA